MKRTDTEKRVVRAAMRWSLLIEAWEKTDSPTEYQEDHIHAAENRVHMACAVHARAKRRRK
mgnify:FL=1